MGSHHEDRRVFIPCGMTHVRPTLLVARSLEVTLELITE